MWRLGGWGVGTVFAMLKPSFTFVEASVFWDQFSPFACNFPFKGGNTGTLGSSYYK